MELYHTITMWYWVVLILLFLVLFTVRERYVEMRSNKEGKLVEAEPTVPSMESAEWRSKIESQAALGADESEYVRELKRFYDTEYKPKRRPKDTDVENFLKTTTNVDKDALRQIILSGFPIDRTETVAARVARQQKIKDVGKYIEPRDGRDETFPRKEPAYIPADTRIGELPEGIYEPVDQQSNPRREGIWDDKSISWTRNSFFSLESK